MRIGRAAGSGFSLAIWAFVLIWAQNVAGKAVDDIVNRILVGLGGGAALWDSARANPLWAYVGTGIWFTLGFLIYAHLRERLFELCDIGVGASGSKQFYQSTEPPAGMGMNPKLLKRPLYFLVQPRFVNHSNRDADNVSARVDVWGPRTMQTHRICSWVTETEKDTPLSAGSTAQGNVVCIAAGGNLPARLNLAIRYNGEPDAYLCTKDSKDAHPDLRHPNYRIESGVHLIRIMLRGKGARTTEWFRLDNPLNADPSEQRIKWWERWWLYVRLLASRTVTH